MKRRLQARITIEAVLAIACLTLAIVTVVDREWIEGLTGADPDAGSGAIEWLVVIGLGLASVILSRLAWRTGRRLRAAGT
ncbi:MAG: ABC transporter permease [Acidimicrobiales bacterium]|nr:MAG: ABC transporter permease [Acidimicrobiales bacterium]